MRKITFTILGWAISIALLALLFAKLDYHKLWEGFAGASWGWLTTAAFINVLVICLKALRWQHLMGPKMPVTYGMSFSANLIGFAGNNVMPARGGDMLKIFLLNKWTGAGKPALASQACLDKLFDGLSIILLFAFLSIHSRFPVWVQKGTTIVSVAILVSSVICILLLIHHKRTGGKDGELGPISRIAKKFGSGMGALTDKKTVAITIMNSVAICLLQVGIIWCCQLAFGEHLGAWVPSLVFVAINLAITIPSAPSGVGPFEVAAVISYTWLGLGKETALNIALMYHAVQFFPVTIAGFVFYLATSRRNLAEAFKWTPISPKKTAASLIDNVCHKTCRAARG